MKYKRILTSLFAIAVLTSSMSQMMVSASANTLSGDIVTSDGFSNLNQFTSTNAVTWNQFPVSGAIDLKEKAGKGVLATGDIFDIEFDYKDSTFNTMYAGVTAGVNVITSNNEFNDANNLVDWTISGEGTAIATNSVQSALAVPAGGAFSRQITGLLPNTKYYYSSITEASGSDSSAKLVVKSANGTLLGEKTVNNTSLDTKGLFFYTNEETSIIISGEGISGTVFFDNMTVKSAGGLYKSTDKAESWAAVSSFPEVLQVNNIVTDVNGKVYVVAGNETNPAELGGVYVSSDNYGSWTKIFEISKPVVLAVDPNNASRILLTTFNDSSKYDSNNTSVYLSEDAGVSWNKINQGLANTCEIYNVEFDPNPANPNTIWLTSSEGGFYKGTIKREESVVVPTVTYENFKAISAGYDHSIAIKSNGDVYCWGENNNAQLGNGTKTETTETVKVNISDVISVHAGRFYSLAVTKDGELYGWGNQAYYQLGTGDMTAGTITTPVRIMGNVKYVFPHSKYTLVITNDNDLYYAGDANSRTLGSLVTNKSMHFTKIMSDVASVAPGEWQAMILKTNGELYATGSEYYDYTNIDPFKSDIVKIMDDVKSVSTGDKSTIAVKSNGDAYYWENENFWKVLAGTAPVGSEPYKIMSDVSAVELGTSHIMALKTNGELYGWGGNNYSQVGHDAVNDSTVNSPTKILDDVVSIASNFNHTLAVKSNSDLYTWGYNEAGKLENGIVTEARKNTVGSMIPLQINEDIMLSVN